MKRALSACRGFDFGASREHRPPYTGLVAWGHPLACAVDMSTDPTSLPADASARPGGKPDSSGGKPVVALALAQEWLRRMFRPADLERLHAAATVRMAGGPRLEAADLPSLLGGADAVITGWGTPGLPADALDAAPTLRLIAHSAGSIKHLVNDATFDRGLRVTTAASANAVPVAQFTIGMITMLLKQMPWIGYAYAARRTDEVQARKPLCRELQDLSVGIIGASRVGRIVIQMLKAYPRVTIKLYDPFVGKESAAAMGCELVSLDDACRCEVVSIHAPSVPSTRHMFNARTLALLPDHAVLVNTARGALIDEAALVAEVKRRPLYVALDVTDPEPPKPDSPLRTAPNVYITPHIAGAMQQARLDMGKLAIDETLRFLRGEPLQFEVTREMLPSQA